MSLPHIVLGLLAEPISGYAIKQEFNTSLRHFWFAELSQLYPALKKLEKEGLAVSSAGISVKGPAKRLYQRTEAGREALLDWLTGGPASVPLRHPYLAQVFFLGAATNPQKAVVFFRDLHSRLSKTLQTLETIEAGWAAEDLTYPDVQNDEEFYKQFTLSAGLATHRAYVAWCEDCIGRIQNRFQLV